MAEMTSEGANQSAGIDLSQFYQVFFEEAGENLDSMEQQLLEINIEAADDEELNSIFRCAHSVKGGAATFGFADVAELTHQMETLLDKLRRHELAPTAAMVDVLLQSGDALRAQLARHQGRGGPEIDTTELLFNIRAMVAGETPPAPNPTAAPVAGRGAAAGTPVSTEDPALPGAKPAVPARLLEVRVGPLAEPAQADNLVELFQEIVDLGTIEPIDGGQSVDGMRRFKIVTTSTDGDLLDLFTFHVAREHVQLLPMEPGYGFFENAPGAPSADAMDDPGYGFFADAPGAPPDAAATGDAPGAAPAPATAHTARARAVARQEK